MNDLDLAALRQRLEDKDHELVRLLAERRDLVLAVGELKQAAGLAVHQPEREAAQAALRAAWAHELGLDPTYVNELFARVVAEARREQAARRR
jgi:chorismate mutase-like protein